MSFGSKILKYQEEMIHDLAEIVAIDVYKRQAFAVLSAIFASLTSIFGKIGVENVEPNLGTAIRTVIVLAMAWICLLYTSLLEPPLFPVGGGSVGNYIFSSAARERWYGIWRARRGDLLGLSPYVASLPGNLYGEGRCVYSRGRTGRDL